MKHFKYKYESFNMDKELYLDTRLKICKTYDDWNSHRSD